MLTKIKILVSHKSKKTKQMNTVEKKDKIRIKQCLELASRGLGKVSPNPLVGCIIIHNNEVIGQGHHEYYGGAHAEVNAINSVIDKNLLKESTLYVNLEPCVHYGNTPPCTDLIIQNKIPKVVIGSLDPYPLVNGKGVEKLRNAGIEVISGVLEKDNKHLNRRFFTYQTQNRPYIILKWAQSTDGFMDIIRQPNEPIGPNWISGVIAKKMVHKWRSEEQAILIGYNTVMMDNPQLTVREWDGCNPIRVTFDKDLTLPKTNHLFDHSVKTIVFTEKDMENQNNIEYIQVSFDENLLKNALTQLAKLKIISVFVEGGAKIHHQFIKTNLWDEARVITGKKEFKFGITAPKLSMPYSNILEVETDKIAYYYNTVKKD